MWWAHLLTNEHRPSQWALTTAPHLRPTTIRAEVTKCWFMDPQKGEKYQRGHRLITTWNPSKLQHRCSQYLKISQNPMTRNLVWGRGPRRNTTNFPKVFAQTFYSCPSWDHFHFSFLWSVLLQENRSLYPLYLETPLNVYKYKSISIYAFTYTYTHQLQAAENHTETFLWPFPFSNYSKPSLPST